jgi:Ca2+-transporting ATPase
MNPHAFPFAGLTDDEVADARKKSGANVYHFEQDYTLLKTIFRLVKEPMILLLMVAALIYFISGAISDAFFILFAIVFQSAISLYQFNRSNKAVLGII